MTSESTPPASLEEALGTAPPPAEAPAEDPVAEAPPPPVVAPPPLESLAEQVQREAHTVPESTGPSDWVPNRPNVRPPEAVETPPGEVPAEAQEPSA